MHERSGRRPAIWAYSDESERAATMYFGVLLIQPGKAVTDARRALRGLLLPGQRRVHTAKESPRRRRQLLDVVAALDVQVVALALTREPGVSASEAREILLARATELVLVSGVQVWSLDRQEPKQEERDRNVVESKLRGVTHRLAYDHVPSTAEPLLWAIDAAIWAVAAGGDWRRRAGERLSVENVTL